MTSSRPLLAIALLLSACASLPSPPSTESGDLRVIPESWSRVDQARRIGAIALSADGKVSTLAVPREKLSDADVSARNGAIVRGEVELTPRYVAIESLDVSEERGEVVFSAQRSSNFDIGLVSTDGSQVNWVPEDGADEVNVQWAPRGNKVSFVVRARSGDLVRTVHIPTSMQLSVDFPYGRVSRLAWDAPAEKYAVVVESIDASPHVQVTKYDGTARVVALEPAAKLAVNAEPLGETTVLVRPEPLRYSEKLPLVIWREEGDRFAWNDARAALLRSTRVAIAVTAEEPSEVLALVGEVPWIDRGRVYVVDPAGSAPVLPNAAMIVRGSSEVPAGQWRRRGEVIETAQGVVESFSAGFIADQLKGTSSENASRR